VAERAVRLPWLVPTAPALVALATAEDPLSHPIVRIDPAAIALILRFAQAPDHRHPIRLRPQDRGKMLRFARKRLNQARLLTEYDPSALYADAQRAMDVARHLAARKFGELTEAAEIVALLSFVGPLAVSAVSSNSIRDVRLLGRSAEISRRLLRRWQLPDWCVATVGAASLRPETAETVGAEPKLVAILRAVKVLSAASVTVDFAAFDALGLDNSSAQAILDNVRELNLIGWDNPCANPMIPDLLRCAERAYRRRRDDFVERLEREVERLHIALSDHQLHESDRLQERKLSAMAEFAAGAGHEINTPLAVISGQAQYLFNLEEDPARRKALQAVIQQARRIHEILTDLMQFARPAKPNLQVLDVGLVVQELIGQFQEDAADRDLRWETEIAHGCLAFADPRQVRTALQCLIRNAVEATPAGGRIRVLGDNSFDDSHLIIVVEDSGAGPDSSIVAHLFDPFYSGRPAGRGRGLGLATAWRLAKEQGGDLRFVPTSECPARFVLSLPKATSFPETERITA